MDAEEIDRSRLDEAARKIFPKATRAKRDELVIEPMEEILGSLAPRKLIDADNGLARKREARKLAKSWPPLRGRMIDWIAREERLDEQRALERSVKEWHGQRRIIISSGEYEPAPTENFCLRPGKMYVSDGEVRQRAGAVPYLYASAEEVRRWKEHGSFSKLDLSDGKCLKVGHSKSPPQQYEYTYRVVALKNDKGPGYHAVLLFNGKPYYGHQSKVGRPANQNKPTNAEKMRAYRARKKAKRT